MKNKAFLLGFYSIGSQVLLLREFISSFNGDELFLGTALFGWLLSVAVGSWFGGRAGATKGTHGLFVTGVVLLLLSLLAARFSPLLVSDVIGEVVPFGTAALLSITLMLPVGLISGWLFASIAREGWKPTDSIVHVYLWEGIGAFAGGLVTTMLVGELLTTLTMGIALAAVVVSFSFLICRDRSLPVTMLITMATILLVIVVKVVTENLENYLDGLKYQSYRIERSFDTHYGHQSLLSRDSLIILLTDNRVEAVFPDVSGAENMLIPPLLYRPSAREILYIGRSEFGVMQLAEKLQHITITAVDARRHLSQTVDEYIPFTGTVIRRDNDPVAYFSSGSYGDTYDIIIVDPGEPDNYRTTRLLTVRFLSSVRNFLSDDGIVVIPAGYDTDRYVSADVGGILGSITESMRASFETVWAWPGETTMLFASCSPNPPVPVDSLVNRIGNLGYIPQYLEETALANRLNELRIDRINAALSLPCEANTLEKPLLPSMQAVYRSSGRDGSWFVSWLFGSSWWLIVIPLMVVLFFVFLVKRKGRRKCFSAFLFFTAGVISLSLELISFYVYQTSAGSLYSEMAALIGAFMFGLALGTYFSWKIDRNHLEYPALFTLLIATLVFLFTCNTCHPQGLFIYHLSFLFSVALATGSLFTAATRRYYSDGNQDNRGSGYALELIGSSAGALLTITVLLPVLGLTWLLISLAALLVMAFAGAVLTQGAA
ncbi:MAG: hypothetical protein U9R56_02575 [candidate division Zixibacteria bacterium]|nr:hypothetical protein [candidate division Zixibacteria bacterium]